MLNKLPAFCHCTRNYYLQPVLKLWKKELGGLQQASEAP